MDADSTVTDSFLTQKTGSTATDDDILEERDFNLSAYIPEGSHPNALWIKGSVLGRLQVAKVNAGVTHISNIGVWAYTKALRTGVAVTVVMNKNVGLSVPVVADGADPTFGAEASSIVPIVWVEGVPFLSWKARVDFTSMTSSNDSWGSDAEITIIGVFA